MLSEAAVFDDAPMKRCYLDVFCDDVTYHAKELKALSDTVSKSLCRSEKLPEPKQAASGAFEKHKLKRKAISSTAQDLLTMSQMYIDK